MFTLRVLLISEQKDINHTHYDSFLLSIFFSLLLLTTWKKEESFKTQKYNKFAYSKHMSRKGFPIARAQLLEHTAALVNFHSFSMQGPSLIKLKVWKADVGYALTSSALVRITHLPLPAPFLRHMDTRTYSYPKKDSWSWLLSISSCSSRFHLRNYFFQNSSWTPP